MMDINDATIITGARAPPGRKTEFYPGPLGPVRALDKTKKYPCARDFGKTRKKSRGNTSRSGRGP